MPTVTTAKIYEAQWGFEHVWTQDVGEVKWIGLETAKRLHRDEEGVIFIDVRDRREFVAGHIADAYCTPLPEIIVAWSWEEHASYGAMDMGGRNRMKYWLNSQKNSVKTMWQT